MTKLRKKRLFFLKRHHAKRQKAILRDLILHLEYGLNYEGAILYVRAYNYHIYKLRELRRFEK